MTPTRHALLAAVALSVSGALTALSGTAHADTVQADALFKEGRELMEAGDTAAACAKFEASLELLERLGVLLNLANCEKEAGRTASAYSHFKQAEAMARKAGEQERVEFAQQGAAELEPILSTLTVVVDSPVEGLVITRDGDELAAASYGVAVPADPGERTIKAEAPGYLPWESTVTIGAEKDTQTVNIPALEEDPNAGVEPVGASTPANQDDGSGLITAGLIIGGVGVVGVGLGAVFGIVASSTASGAEDDATLCPNKQCTSAGREEIDSAETSATISTIGFIAGGVALAAGATLIIVGAGAGPDSPEDTARLQLVPVASPGGGGLFARGSF